MQKRFSKIAVIGAGRVGTALALKLKSHGQQIVTVINRTTSSGKKAADNLGAVMYSTQLRNIPGDTELIIIATPAQAIPAIVRQLSSLPHLKFRKLFVVHTSGAHSAKILAPLSRKGSHIASIHPIQTFPANQPNNERLKSLKNIYYGIDAPQKSLREAKSLVKLLGGKHVIIKEEMRPLYHALCVFSSGYIVQLIAAIDELSRKLKFPEPWHVITGPLMVTAMQNAIDTTPQDALTGPILRGDTTTITLHMKALKKHLPGLILLYTSLGENTARTAMKNKSIDKKTYAKLITLLSRS